MGLLDSILGRSGAREGGGASPLTLALLALLAYRTYQGGGPLADMLNRKTGPASSPPDGNDNDDDGDASAPPRGGAGLEGLGDMLGGLLSGGLGQWLGGAASGTILSGGLEDLIRRMQESGFGDEAGSWVGTGRNREIAPQDLEQALGRDTIENLSEQTGRPYLDVLSELSRSLPDTVDRLTPEGRLPTEDELPESA